MPSWLSDPMQFLNDSTGIPLSVVCTYYTRKAVGNLFEARRNCDKGSAPRAADGTVVSGLWRYFTLGASLPTLPTCENLPKTNFDEFFLCHFGQGVVLPDTHSGMSENPAKWSYSSQPSRHEPFLPLGFPVD